MKEIIYPLRNFSQGLRPSKRNVRSDDPPLVECVGAVPRDKVLAALDSISQTDTTNLCCNFPTSLVETVGSIYSGSLSDVQTDDSNYLILNEISANPAFDYTFVFTNIPASLNEIRYAGYYEGNPGHKVEAMMWNYVTGPGWVDLLGTEKDFPDADEDYDPPLTFDVPSPTSSYVSSGEARLRIWHNGQGTPGHYQHVNRLSLSTETVTFPYPQIFICRDTVIVCSQTEIYELISGVLVRRASNLTAGTTWSVVDFERLIMLSNSKVLVTRDAESLAWSEYSGSTLPTFTAACNFKGQLLVGGADVGASGNI